MIVDKFAGAKDIVEMYTTSHKIKVGGSGHVADF